MKRVMLSPLIEYSPLLYKTSVVFMAKNRFKFNHFLIHLEKNHRPPEVLRNTL